MVKPDGSARTGSHGRFGSPVRNAATPRDSGSAGGVGAAGRLRKRRESDDGAGLGAFARDGRPSFDRRRTGTAGSAGVGAKRLACFACGCGWRVISMVVRAVRRQHDQSARQSSAAAVASGLESAGFWTGARSRCDVAVWVSARPARIVRQSS